MIKPEFQEFFYPNGLMSPHGSNDIVYTTQFCILGGGMMKSVANDAFEEHYPENRFVNSDGSIIISHDNLTALRCLNKVMGLGILMPFEPEHAYLHPRDFVFYMYASGGLSRILSYFLLWIPLICYIWSILIPSYTSTGKRETSTILLAWMSFTSFNLPIIKFICNLLIKLTFGNLNNIMKIYYPEGHPNIILSEGI